MIYRFLILLLLLTSCFGPNEIKTYQIYSAISWEGVNLHGTEKSIQGLTEDILYEIGKREGFKVQLTLALNGTRLQLLDRSQVDAVITTQVASPREEKEYIFSEPFFVFGPVLIIRQEDTYKGFEALKHKVIGYERSWESSLTAQADMGYIFRPYDQVIALIEDLLTGKIDAVVLDSIYAYQLSTGLYAGKIKVAARLPASIQYRLAVKKGKNEEFITLFNSGLNEIKQEHVYAKILNYWALPDE